ncbi:hypothetical protein B0H34DRAFT_623599, partial [Crassisporium funariophilum]
ASKVLEIDSGDESDGQSAFKKVEEADTAKSGRRGPRNKSMRYFRDPIPVKDGGAKL